MLKNVPNAQCDMTGEIAKCPGELSPKWCRSFILFPQTLELLQLRKASYVVLSPPLPLLPVQITKVSWN